MSSMNMYKVTVSFVIKVEAEEEQRAIDIGNELFNRNSEQFEMNTKAEATCQHWCKYPYGHTGKCRCKGCDEEFDGVPNGNRDG